MKKIFSCYTPFSWECTPRKDKNRWMCALMDIIRISDMLPQFKGLIDVGISSDWKRCEEIYEEFVTIRSNKKVEDLIVIAIEMCKDICYPSHISSERLKNIFSEIGFESAVKEYLEILGTYENSFLGKKKLSTSLKKCNKNSLGKLFNLFKTQKIEPVKKIKDIEDYVCEFFLDTKISENQSFTSIYDLLILKGLLTTPVKNNPYVIFSGYFANDGEGRNSKVWIDKLKNSNQLLQVHDLEIFLDHFSLHTIKIEDQSTLFDNLAKYLIERITNVNLVNCIYNIYSGMNEKINDKSTWDLLLSGFGCLSIYPLVKFRLRVIEWLTKDYKKKGWVIDDIIIKDIFSTIIYQTFVYFPLLQNVFSLLFEPSDTITYNDRLDKERGNTLFREAHPRDDKKRGFSINPVHDFPNLFDEESKTIYNSMLVTVMTAYYESLTLPNDFNVRMAQINFNNTATMYMNSNRTGDYFSGIYYSHLDRYVIEFLRYHSSLAGFVDNLDKRECY